MVLTQIFVSNSQRTLCVSIKYQWIIWREIIVVNSKNHKRHTNELAVQNTELFNAAISGTCSKSYGFKSLNNVTLRVTLAFYRHNLCQHKFHKLVTVILPSQSLHCNTISPDAFAITLSSVSTHTDRFVTLFYIYKLKALLNILHKCLHF